MPRRTAAANARFEEKRLQLEAELQKYRTLAREMRNSAQSTLVKTHKGKEYQKRVSDLQGQLEMLGK